MTFTIDECCVMKYCIVCVGWVINHAVPMVLQRCIQFLPKCSDVYWQLYSRTVNWVSLPLSFERMIRLLTSTFLLDQSYMKPTGWSCRSVGSLQEFSVQRFGVPWHQNSTENISCARQAKNWYTYMNNFISLILVCRRIASYQFNTVASLHYIFTWLALSQDFSVSRMTHIIIM